MKQQLENPFSFAELRQKLQSLHIKEFRFDLEDYLEFVVQTPNLVQVKKILELYFGRAVDPEAQASEEAIRFVEKFGGIRANQTLFYSSHSAATEYAMIWPWSDGTQASVKIAHCKSYGIS